MRHLRSLTVFGSAIAIGLGLTGAASANTNTTAAAPKPAIIYNSVVTGVGNLPSVGAEAYSFSEFGNSVTFGGKTRRLTKAVVSMSSWGCGSGDWHDNNCVTKQGAGFSEPITLNIYGPSTDGLHPGALITSVTRTFFIPYRPSASPQCGTTGEWYDSVHKKCNNGKLVNLTFNLGGKVPNNVVYGIAYNTTHHGYNPIGESAPCFTSSGGCGYDSLNIALSQDPINVHIGYDTNPGKVWQNSSQASEYCDNGAAGTDVFRLDSPTSTCWGVDNNAPYNAPYYVPAVQFTAVS
jgi:hypothetical protein